VVFHGPKKNLAAAEAAARFDCVVGSLSTSAFLGINLKGSHQRSQLYVFFSDGDGDQQGQQGQAVRLRLEQG
jgi:hypothetical protein